jgi:hypothetical protein
VNAEAALDPVTLLPISSWSPLRLGTNKLIQNLPTLTYESSTYGGRSVLADSARTGTKREPRQQRVYLFDGSNDHLTYGAKLTPTSCAAFTIVGWVKFAAATGAYQTICAEYGSGGNRALNIGAIATTGTMRVSLLEDGTNVRKQYDSIASICDNVWHHIAVSFGAGVLTVYLDGTAAAVTKSTDLSITTIFNSTSPFCIGSQEGSTALAAMRLKDFRLYSTAKTAAEIAAIYNQASTPTTIDTTGLLAWYACEEESGGIAYDSSGNGKHLTITNASTLPGGTFHATDSTLPHGMANEYGGSYGLSIVSNNPGSYTTNWLSNETLGASTDGYVEWIVEGLSANVISGVCTLSTLPAANAQNSFECGWYYLDASNIRRYDSGSFTSVACALAIGDRMRLVRTGSVWTLTKNGSLVTTFLSTTTAAVRAACALALNTTYTTCTTINGQSPTTKESANTASISTRVIPRSLSTPANDVLGNTVNYTGQVPHFATCEPPCITGDGAAVVARMAIPAPDSGSISFLYYHLTNGSTFQLVLDARSNSSTHRIQFYVDRAATVYSSGAGNMVASDGGGTTQLDVPGILTSGAWHLVTMNIAPANCSISIQNLSTGSVNSASTTARTPVVAAQSLIGLLGAYYDGSWATSTISQGRLSDLRVTASGVTKYFNFQEGPGDAGTNRTLYGYASDGSAVTSGTLVNGTVSTIWANRCPYAKDYAVANGSRVSSGVTIPGNPNTGLAADGNALNRASGYPTIDSTRLDRINYNPYTAAGLNPYAAETAAFPEDDRETIAPVNTKFRRVITASQTTDRHFIAGNITGYTATGLTGSDLANADAYVGAYSLTPTADYIFPFNTGTIVPSAGAYTLTTSRALAAYVKDHEGLLKLAKSGEVRFNRMRRVENFIAGNTSTWATFSTAASGTGTASKTTGQTDPLGGTDAIRLQCTKGSGNGYMNGNIVIPTGSTGVVSFWIKSNTGSTQTLAAYDNNKTGTAYATATTSWRRWTFTTNGVASGAISLFMGCIDTGADATIDVLLAFPQVENATGQAITAPSEYVSVGVLSTPFHGCGVDGVKYFSTANGNTVS